MRAPRSPAVIAISEYSGTAQASITAATKPTPVINPIAVEVMKEVGIDMSKQKPKVLTSEIISNSFKNVNMGCMDKTECPAGFTNSLDWNIEDPKGKPIEKVREIRDNIEQKVRQLCKTLE